MCLFDSYGQNIRMIGPRHSAVKLNRALKNNLLSFSDNKKDLKLNKINIICIGTPVDEFLNPQYKIILSLVKDLLKIIKY